MNEFKNVFIVMVCCIVIVLICFNITMHVADFNFLKTEINRLDSRIDGVEYINEHKNE